MSNNTPWWRSFGRTRRDRPRGGLPLAVDPEAETADPTAPAFAARPEGAPAYYGFTVLEDVEVDGLLFGTITDFESAPADYGDAFVIAPDGRRAGLVWEISPPRIEQVLPPDPGRWGVWAVWFPHPMIDRASARRNLAAIVPLLRPHWEAG